MAVELLISLFMYPWWTDWLTKNAWTNKLLRIKLHQPKASLRSSYLTLVLLTTWWVNRQPIETKFFEKWCVVVVRYIEYKFEIYQFRHNRFLINCLLLIQSQLFLRRERWELSIVTTIVVTSHLCQPRLSLWSLRSMDIRTHIHCFRMIRFRIRILPDQQLHIGCIHISVNHGN